MDYSPLVPFICGIFQAGILECIATHSSRTSSWPRDQTWVSCTACIFFTVWATRVWVQSPEDSHLSVLGYSPSLGSPYSRKWRGTKKPIDESKRGEWKSWLKAQHSEKIMASGPITSWEIDGDTVETVLDFIFLGSKSLQMVIAAMKLKDAYSLEGKLLPT